MFPELTSMFSEILILVAVFICTFKNVFICLLAALSLFCCTWAVSGSAIGGCSLVAAHGLLIVVASLVAECGF